MRGACVFVFGGVASVCEPSCVRGASECVRTRVRHTFACPHNLVVYHTHIYVRSHLKDKSFERQESFILCYADVGLYLLLSVTREASPLRLGACWRTAGGEFLVVSAVGRGAHCLALPRVAVGLLCTAAVAAMKLAEKQGTTTRWHSHAKDDLDLSASGIRPPH